MKNTTVEANYDDICIFLSYFTSICSYVHSYPEIKFVLRLLLSESEHFEENATVVVYSNGIKPSTTNLRRMNEIIAERGLGMGAVLVHKLTNTDMSNTGLV
jgi:hypothetical protein